MLGVSVAPTAPSPAGISTGAVIGAVAPGGAADKAGITAGSVITKVNDRLIPDGDALVAAIRSHIPGDTLTLTVHNPGGCTRTVQVTLQSATVKAGH